MPLNVDFLQEYPQWQRLHEFASEAERHVFANPRTSLYYCRLALEWAVKWMYSVDGYLEYPGKDRYTLSDLIHTKSFQETLDGSGLFQPIKLIIRLGNLAVHDDSPITSEKSLLIFEHLFAFLVWIQEFYLDQPIKNLSFNANLIPTDTAITNESRESLHELEKRVAEQDAELEQIQAENVGLKKQLDELSHRTSTPVIALAPQDEARTRQLIIDVMLREAGWNPHGDHVREYEVEGMPNKTGLGYCDYVLWSDAGLPLAVIEVKSTVHDATKGKNQARIYAERLEKQHGQKPLMFYTNGYETWMWDDYFYPPRRVSSFYSKEDLEWALQKRNERQMLNDYQPSSEIVERLYQLEAIKRVTEDYQTGKRKALLVMATGTGKTRVAIALVDLLKRAGWVKNALFLADRRELVGQADGEFKKHLPTVTTCNLLEDKEDASARVYFSTYQTMMGFIAPGVDPKFSPGFFDLIIIDEAHRSIYNKFGLIFEFFDALLLGLTATPKSDVDHDTYEFFGLPQNIPTFAYEYQQAIDEKFLVPVKPVSVFFKFLHDGIDREDLSPEEQEEYDKRVLPHKHATKVSKDEVNKFLFNKDTIQRALKVLFEHGIRVDGGDRLGKTIIFARNKEHARLIVNVFDEMMPHLKGTFAAEIHYAIPYAGTLIQDFKIADKDPILAVSVDMLDTGIDVPEVVNLVMFKPVFSLTKFWQMIGRATRLSKDLFGPKQDKTHALLFDFCGNVEYFKYAEKESPNPIPIPLSGQLFRERVQLVREFFASGAAYDALRTELISLLVSQLRALDEHHFALRPHLPLLVKFRHEESWQRLEESDAMKLTDGDGFAKLVYDSEPEDKKRVDILLVRLQRSILGVTVVPGTDARKTQLRTIAETLYQKRMVPQVADHAHLLKSVMDVRFFERTSALELGEVRKVFRELIRLLDKEQKVTVHTNFEDELQSIEFDGRLPAYGDFSDYREHIGTYVKKHQEHVAIQKLRRNKPITQTDIEAFAEMLERERVGTKEEFDRYFSTSEGNSFGVFVRGLLGLERAAAKEAFAALLQNGANLTANQINFIEKIIDYLCVNGVLSPDKLVEQPFTSLHHEGVFGLFDEATVEGIVKVVQSVQATAIVEMDHPA